MNRRALGIITGFELKRMLVGPRGALTLLAMLITFVPQVVTYLPQVIALTG